MEKDAHHRRAVSAPTAKDPAEPASWCGQLFMTEGLNSLCGVQLRSEQHRPVGEIGPSVRAVGQRLVSEQETCLRHLPGQPVPEPVGRLPGQQGGPDDLEVRQRPALGLDVVEHIRDPHPHQPARPRTGRLGLVGCARPKPRTGLPVAAGVVAGGDPSGDRGEDLDALLAFADLPAQGLPGPVAGDVAGVGAL